MVKEMTLSERFCDLLRRNEVEVGVLRLLNYKYCAVAIGNRICSTSSPFAVSLLLISYCDRIKREETHRGNDETWLMAVFSRTSLPDYLPSIHMSPLCTKSTVITIFRNPTNGDRTCQRSFHS